MTVCLYCSPKPKTLLIDTRLLGTLTACPSFAELLLELQGDDVLGHPRPILSILHIFGNTFTYIYFPLLTCPLFHIHVPCTCPNVMCAFSYSVDKYFTLRTRTSVVWLPRANAEVNIYLLSFYLLY